MKIDELKKELGNKNFYKLCVYGSLVLLTIIAYFIKGSNIEININWELLGFIGVIITIIYTEKSRIKQNQYDYKKEKIADEQIEFRHVIKESVDLLDFSKVMVYLFNVDMNNYKNMIFEVSGYQAKILNIKDNIKWYYEKGVIPENSEISNFFELLDEYLDYYNKKLEEYNNIILKYSKIKFLQENPNILSIKEMAEVNPENKTLEELRKGVVDQQSEIFCDILNFGDKNFSNLYKQAHLVIEERDNLMKDKLD